MKKVRIGINGFGRIGRLILRASLDFPNVEVVAVNDHSSNVDYMVYMLKYDTVHGKFDADVYVDNGYLVVNGKRIRVFNESEPSAIKWGEEKSMWSPKRQESSPLWKRRADTWRAARKRLS